MLLTASIILGVTSLLSLLILHFVSPEFQPSWRMVSEYALGKHKWLLTLFFITWGISSVMLAIGLIDSVSGLWATGGLVLIALSGIGAVCGGLFDIKHPLHGASFGLGVPTLPIGALLVTYHLQNKAIVDGSATLILAHSTWISVILMAIGMGVMFSGFKKAGIVMEKDGPALEKVPEGVIALGGYANRLLVLCYIGWIIVAAQTVL